MLIELVPYISSAYYQRAEMKYELGDTESSCKDYSKALELGLEEASDAIKKKCNK